MKLFLCSHFSSVGSLIKEEIDNKKHQRRKHMSRVGFVRNSIYEKGLKKMARA